MNAEFADDVLKDDLAVSLALANKRAREMGVDIDASLISISQLDTNGGQSWRVNYGPKDYVGRRGGDLIVEVEPGGAGVQRVLRGQ